MRKILITGGTGLLGINWANKIKNNYRVILGINKNNFLLKNVESCMLNYNEIKELKLQLLQINPSVIIHAAGITDIEKCQKNKKKAKEVNINFSKNIAFIANKLNIKFVYISTDHLFSGKKSYYSEKELAKPLNYYALTKSIAEKKVIKFNKNALIIRTNFYAWGTHYRQSFSDKIINSLRSHEDIYLFDDVFFNPIIVDKLVLLVHKLIDSNFKGIFNISSNERLSKYEFGLKIAKIFKLNKKFIKKTSIDKLKTLSPRPKDMSLSNKKVSSILKTNIGNIDSDLLLLKKNEKYISEIKPYLSYGKHFIDEEDVMAVAQTIKYNENLTQGYLIEKFEKMIANYVGAKYAVAVTSCTAGMHLACMAANLSNNQNLITSPITFVSTANVAFYTNATPIFSDIDPKTLNLCPKNLTKTLKSNPKTKVILPVHFAGMPCDMLKIKKIADSKNISIIEDAAHALGAKYKNGLMVGSCCHSLATVFSFHPVKLIASGEGGMITTNNQEFYKKLLRLRSHGINKLDDNFVYKNSAYEKGIKNLWYYEMQELGYHYRITDFQCSLAISQFKKIDKFLVKRKKLVKRYLNHFKKFKNCEPAQKFNINMSAHHLFILNINFKKINKSRGQLMKELDEFGVGTQVHYIPVPMQPYYRKINYNPDMYPNSIKYYEGAISIPLYYSLTYKEQDYIINCLKKLVG